MPEVVIRDVPDSLRACMRRERVPIWQAPTLATLTGERFSDPDWIFERKLDGVRTLAVSSRGTTRLWSRNQKEMTRTYPELGTAFEQRRYAVGIHLDAGREVESSSLEPIIQAPGAGKQADHLRHRPARE